jgi:hypothetical protein
VSPSKHLLWTSFNLDNGVWKWRGWLSSIRELYDIFKPRFAFQAWRTGWSLNTKLKSPSSQRAWCHKAVGCICFTEKWRAEILQHGSVWQFQTQASMHHLQRHILAVWFVFRALMVQFSGKESHELPDGTNVVSSTKDGCYRVQISMSPYSPSPAYKNRHVVP